MEALFEIVGFLVVLGCAIVGAVTIGEAIFKGIDR